MSSTQMFSKSQVEAHILDSWWLAIRNAHEKANAAIILTKDEAIALYAYTNCCPPFYKEINQALRKGIKHYLVDLIDSALHKLPLENCLFVHRWALISMDELSELKAGRVVKNLAYTSTNKEENKLDMCSYDCDSMRIFLHNGRSIRYYSDDSGPGYNEILIPKGAMFKLLSDNPESDFQYELMQIS